MKNNQEIKELFDSMALSKQKSKLIVGGGGNTGGGEGGTIPGPPGAMICILNNCNQACNTSCTNCVTDCTTACQTGGCPTKASIWNW